jgi:hypothetical protein
MAQSIFSMFPTFRPLTISVHLAARAILFMKLILTKRIPYLWYAVVKVIFHKPSCRVPPHLGKRILEAM